MTIRAVVFDLDDTLAVTSRDRERLLGEAAHRAGVDPHFDREDYVRAHGEHSAGGTRRPVFEALVEDGEDAAHLTRAYREAIGTSLAPVDGAAAMLTALRSRYRLGLLTDGPEEAQRDKLRRLGWCDAFDAVLVTGGLDAPKPDPAAFDAIADALDVDAGAVVYVGDSPDRDVVGATEAGMHPVQVVFAGGPDPHPSAAAVVRREELRSLPRVLESLGGDRPDDP